MDDFVSDEYASVSGYSRKTLGFKTMTVSTSNNGQIVFSSAAITYTELAVSAGQTVTHMLFLKDVGGLDSTRPAICILNLVEIGQSFTGTANDVTITPPSGGWFRFANNA